MMNNTLHIVTHTYIDWEKRIGWEIVTRQGKIAFNEKKLKGEKR